MHHMPLLYMRQKLKKPHNIGETLLKPCILESVKLVLEVKASQAMKQISLSNDTIKSRIHEMSDNITSKVLSKIESSPVFALQLDESTDISNLLQLLVYVRYVADERINEEFLFCQPLETTSKAFSLFCVLPVKMQRDVYSQIFIDVSPGNRRQASSENRTQGGKPTLSESSKKYSSGHQNFC